MPKEWSTFRCLYSLDYHQKTKLKTPPAGPPHPAPAPPPQLSSKMLWPKNCQMLCIPRVSHEFLGYFEENRGAEGAAAKNGFLWISRDFSGVPMASSHRKFEVPFVMPSLDSSIEVRRDQKTS